MSSTDSYAAPAIAKNGIRGGSAGTSTSGGSGPSSSDPPPNNGKDDPPGLLGDGGAQRPRRSRVLLSCSHCRNSKLKCDRSQPCGQCIKRGRPKACQYAPKPEKLKPAKSMAGRLKRLEGMVRSMMEEGGDSAGARGAGQASSAAARTTDEGVATGAQVVRGEKGSTYVGATHFMAMLEDIEDMKGYFEESETPVDDQDPATDYQDGLGTPEMLMFSASGAGAPQDREELLNIIPDRQVVDRLVMRYFAANSPDAHVIHRPSFVKDYAQFWRDPHGAHVHWLALLFMVMAFGLHYSTFMAPHEPEMDSSEPVTTRIKRFRAAAAWCLVWGKYDQPTELTIPPFILFADAEFLLKRNNQMNCYLLMSTLMRLMLKMGFHRDPSKLGHHLSPFEAEMRRRRWYMGVTIDLLVSFHMGLPTMIHGIESDTRLPENILDEDFGPESTELPPPRTMTDYTPLTYAIIKNSMMRCFTHVARQAHALTPPSHAEVLRLDDLLQETWRSIPSFMMVRSVDESVADPPAQIVQRFGISSIYNKSRCVLHRRYLAEPVARREHDYSRRQCLDAAMIIIGNQASVWKMCQPGNVLNQHGWFLSSIAVHDFLLSAVILFLVIKNEKYPAREAGFGDTQEQGPVPSKEELTEMLRRAHGIWSAITRDIPEVRKTADIVRTMLENVGSPVSSPPEVGMARDLALRPGAEAWADSGAAGSLTEHLFTSGDLEAASHVPDPVGDGGTIGGHLPLDLNAFATTTAAPASSQPFDASLVMAGQEIDWGYFDNVDMLTAGDLSATNPGEMIWLSRSPLNTDDFHM